MNDYSINNAKPLSMEESKIEATALQQTEESRKSIIRKPLIEGNYGTIPNLI